MSTKDSRFADKSFKEKTLNAYVLVNMVKDGS